MGFRAVQGSCNRILPWENGVVNKRGLVSCIECLPASLDLLTVLHCAPASHVGLGAQHAGSHSSLLSCSLGSWVELPALNPSSSS